MSSGKKATEMQREWNEEAGDTVENKSYFIPVTLVPTFSIANQTFWWLNQIFQRSCPLVCHKKKKRWNLPRDVWNTNSWMEGQMLIGKYYRRLADSETVFHKKNTPKNKIPSIEAEKIFGGIRRSKDLFSARSCPYQINLDYLFNLIYSHSSYTYDASLGSFWVARGDSREKCCNFAFPGRFFPYLFVNALEICQIVWLKIQTDHVKNWLALLNMLIV